MAIAFVLVLSAVARGAAAERVDVTAMDGTQLIGELAGATGPGVVVAHAGGDAGARWQDLAARVAAQGFRVLRCDPRGHGASSGTPDARAASQDLEGAYRYLLGRKIRPVFLVASEAVAAAALDVAARVPVAGVVVIGAAPQRATVKVPMRVLPSDTPEAIDALVRWLRAPQPGT